MVLIKISPVILMVLIGFFCRKTEMITTEGMEGLKTLATSLMLPVLLFHTLATIHISYYCRHRNNASGAFRCFYHRNAHKKSCPVGRNIFPLFSHQL